MELYFSSLSDIGNVRRANEDNLFAGRVKKDTYLFVVADGMGGHDAGEIASRTAVTLFTKAAKRNLKKNIPDFLKKTVFKVNDTLMKESKKSNTPKGMGTTLSALYIKNDQAYIAHVGDSRIYRYSESGLIQLTEDHSLVGKLLKGGLLTEDEAYSHPQRNVLYQSVGLKSKIEVQCTGPFPIQPGQKFLLCSDGLNNELKDSEIEIFMAFRSTRKIVDNLIQRAKVGAASDNISVIAVTTEIDETAIPDETVKMTVPPEVRRKKEAPKKKKKKFGLFPK